MPRHRTPGLFGGLLLAAILLTAPAVSHAATRTIANGGGNWNSTSTWVEGVVPTSADDVVATATSGNVTINTAAAARSVNLANYQGTLTHNASITLSIGDAAAGSGNVALKFPSGMTYTLGNAATSAVSFVSTSGTVQTVDFGGKTAGNVTFNGAGGSWQLASDLHVGSSALLTLTRGTLDANDYDVTAGRFFSATATTRSLVMGSGEWRLTGNNLGSNKAWNTGTLSAMTIDPGTAVVHLTYTGSVGNRGIQTSCGSVMFPTFRISGGTDNLFITNLCDAANVDFSGFSGTIIRDPGGPSGAFVRTRGNLTLSSAMSFASDLTESTFAFNGTGSKTLTTNGLSLPRFSAALRSAAALVVVDEF